MRRFPFFLLLTALALPVLGQQLPLREGSLRLAVIGDSGTGRRAQYEVAQQLAASRLRFPFTLVLMLGDNLYGGQTAWDFARKFERPYQPLLEAGVRFYATLGNHDRRPQLSYKNFNMNGQRYYSFSPAPGIRFFCLDSNHMDRAQLDWLEKELTGGREQWKICFFHHPLYSSGRRYGSNLRLRSRLEPLFVRYGVNVAFAGHEHFYQRVVPQNGIHYFISGGAGKLRRGNIASDALLAKGFDRDHHFMLLEVAGEEMHFQAVSRSGEVVDTGVIRRTGAPLREAPAKPAR